MRIEKSCFKRNDYYTFCTIFWKLISKKTHFHGFKELSEAKTKAGQCFWATLIVVSAALTTVLIGFGVCNILNDRIATQIIFDLEAPLNLPIMICPPLSFNSSKKAIFGEWQMLFASSYLRGGYVIQSVEDWPPVLHVIPRSLEEFNANEPVEILNILLMQEMNSLIRDVFATYEEIRNTSQKLRKFYLNYNMRLMPNDIVHAFQLIQKNENYSIIENFILKSMYLPPKGVPKFFCDLGYCGLEQQDNEALLKEGFLFLCPDRYRAPIRELACDHVDDGLMLVYNFNLTASDFVKINSWLQDNHTRSDEQWKALKLETRSHLVTDLPVNISNAFNNYQDIFLKSISKYVLCLTETGFSPRYFLVGTYETSFLKPPIYISSLLYRLFYEEWNDNDFRGNKSRVRPECIETEAFFQHLATSTNKTIISAVLDTVRSYFENLSEIANVKFNNLLLSNNFSNAFDFLNYVSDDDSKWIVSISKEQSRFKPVPDSSITREPVFTGIGPCYRYHFRAPTSSKSPLFINITMVTKPQIEVRVNPLDTAVKIFVGSNAFENLPGPDIIAFNGAKNSLVTFLSYLSHQNVYSYELSNKKQEYRIDASNARCNHQRSAFKSTAAQKKVTLSRENCIVDCLNRHASDQDLPNLTCRLKDLLPKTREICEQEEIFNPQALFYFFPNDCYFGAETFQQELPTEKDVCSASHLMRNVLPETAKQTNAAKVKICMEKCVPLCDRDSMDIKELYQHYNVIPANQFWSYQGQNEIQKILCESGASLWSFQFIVHSDLTKYIDKLTYTWDSFFGIVGGQLGVVMGASVLSLVHLCYMFLLAVRRYRLHASVKSKVNKLRTRFNTPLKLSGRSNTVQPLSA